MVRFDPVDGVRLSTILVATDFSAPAELATRCAGEHAARQGARLLLLHVQPHPVATLSAPAPMSLHLGETDSVGRALERKLRARAESLRAGAAISVEPVLRIGSPGRTIVEVADELGAELVVVGTDGRGGLQHFVMGGTVERVVQRSRVPVLTVHSRPGRHESEPRSVLIPVDLVSDPAPVVQGLLRLLGERVRSCDLVLLHCERPRLQLRAMGEELGLDGLGRSGVEGDCRVSLERVAERLRREGFGVATLGCEGEPSELIPLVASARAADLIAMETRGLTGLAHMILGSTAERVAHRAHCPVLTLQRSPAPLSEAPEFVRMTRSVLSA